MDNDEDGSESGDSDSDESESESEEEEEEEAGGAGLAKFLPQLLSAPNTPKKEGKFLNFAKNTLKIESEEDRRELYTMYKAKKQ